MMTAPAQIDLPESHPNPSTLPTLQNINLDKHRLRAVGMRHGYQNTLGDPEPRC